jgi:predicted phage tail protein
MNASDIRGFGGGKGGGGGSSPTETPDNLHSTAFAKVLDLINDGEVRGPVNGLQSVFFNETPLQNPDGSMNFSGVTIDFRSGTQFQDYIAGFPSVENELAIGVELKSVQPWVRAINNLQLSAVRVRIAVSALSKADTSNGNINGYRIEYAIDVSTDNGAFQQVLATAFDGKTTSKYERSHRVELPPAAVGWSVRVRRITPNANSSAIADTTSIASITEVIDAKLRYPMSALVGVQVDASQFQNVPTRAYDMYLSIVRVPSNYDPYTRIYTGVWDGTFKPAWTDNPAWVFYDMVLNDRYGLGDRLNASQISKWSLYQIAQYCDVLVPDGRGGQEPRFTCNLYLQTRAAAYKVLQDMASIFRGIAYWSSGSIVASADMPTDPVYVYTAANVIDGKFQRVGSRRKTRYTVALVSWNDPADFYRAKVEYVPDDDGIERYGVQQVEMTAFGCTSQAQAQRAGKWALLTSRLETGTITFSVGLDGAVAAPGQIVRVSDPHRMGRRNAGRIRAAAGRVVTLDKAPVVAVGDKLTVILPTAVSETRIVQSIVGDDVTVTAAWSVLPAPESVWAVDSVDLVAPTYKIMSVVEKDGLIFEITATQHEPGKFAYIDNGTRIETRPETVIPPSVQPPPANVQVLTHEVVNQGLSTTVMTIAWEAAAHAVAYFPEWRKDDGNWIAMPRTGQTSAEVQGIYAGRYTARVRAVNPLEVRSVPAYSVETVLTGKTTPPPQVTSLITTALVFGIGVSWGFPAQGASDTQRTEIWYSRTPDRGDAIKLADYAYPQNSTTLMGLAAGTSLFFWAKLVDRSGNEGEFYPAGVGVNGQSSSDPTEYEKYFLGQINESAMGQALQAKIEMIGDLRDELDKYPDGADVWKAIVSQQNAAENLDAIAATQIIASIGADSATSIVRTVLGAKVATNEAKIQEVATTTADALGAMASHITTVEATAGQAQAAAQQSLSAIANTDGKLSAMYSVKLQVHSPTGATYAAGFGLGIDNDSGSFQSQFVVAADRFAVLDVNGTVKLAPFVVQGGQVFISQALIGTGWITNAMIGSTIQSTAVNSATGQPVWILDKGGLFQMNGSGSWGRLTMDSQAIRVFDDGNVKRVQLGNLSV